jgi:hypothetical protein
VAFEWHSRCLPDCPFAAFFEVRAAAERFLYPDQLGGLAGSEPHPNPRGGWLPGWWRRPRLELLRRRPSRGCPREYAERSYTNIRQWTGLPAMATSSPSKNPTSAPRTSAFFHLLRGN